MAKTIYKLYLIKPTEAWYQLTSEEKANQLKFAQESLEKVGGKSISGADCSWSTEEWAYWGVEEFPSIEAQQQHVKNLMANGHYRYVDSKIILGSEVEQG